MKRVILSAIFWSSIVCFSQTTQPSSGQDWHNLYQAKAQKINDLVDTKLDVSFNFEKSWMFGKAQITLHPHFYPTDSLTLDAKNMEINEVAIIDKKKHIPLHYQYNGKQLQITLDKSYLPTEDYTIYIDYIAKPNDNPKKDQKGLYFINPLGNKKNKPTQIWTQGETEFNSAWFPTIDKPNQKTTDEIRITVPDKYKTLSNGLLISQKKNKNGTRSDIWRMNLPHAPYLIMMAIGEFEVVKDKYKNKEVNYYIDKKYLPVAKKIFGNTPEMMSYFSGILGVEYPWQKYDQVAMADYVYGAMENTTATLHSENAQQDPRQLIDGNNWEWIIAHELFHQWFGDYVTCESWSNIAINESFANLSEIFWEGYKYGQDASDEHNYIDMLTYLNGKNHDKNLVRFFYKDPWEAFDEVGYQKGGRILNMLRYYIGDSAFFKSLNLFLSTYKFKTADVEDLKRTFEKVTGQDLNWFWEQWFYDAGHPKLDISYEYIPGEKIGRIFLTQLQKERVFKFRVAVDIYHGKEKKRQFWWIDQPIDTLTFAADSKPDLINFDGEKILLCEKTDHKTINDFIFQYHNAGLYVDRREAIDYAAEKQTSDPKAFDLLKTALNDNYSGLRTYALGKLDIKKDSIKQLVEPILFEIAQKDNKSSVKAAAIKMLGNYKNEKHKDFFIEALSDSSYSIAGNALLALGEIDSIEALNQAKILSKQNVKGMLEFAIDKVNLVYATEDNISDRISYLRKIDKNNRILNACWSFGTYLKKVKDPDKFQKGVDAIINTRDSIIAVYGDQILSYFNKIILDGIAQSKQKEGLTEQADYINSKILSSPEDKMNTSITEKSDNRHEGKYEFWGGTFQINQNQDQTLRITFNSGNQITLIPVTKNKFSIQDKQDYSAEFVDGEKLSEDQLIIKSPEGNTFKAIKTN